MTTPRPLRIAIWTLPEPGHLTPTLRIAGTLQERGHDVRFIAPPPMRERISTAGFPVVPWFDDRYDDAWTQRTTEGSVVRRRRAITERYAGIAAALRRGDGTAVELDRFAPDVVVADVNEPLIGFLAHRRGIPVVVLNTSLPQTSDPGVPPLRATGTARTDRLGRLATDLAWRRFRAERVLGAALARPLGAEPPYRLTERFAADIGLTPHDLDRRTVFYPQLRHRPELVLCPEAFDLPRPHRPLRYYVESMRPGSPVAADPLPLPPGDAPLVYCSLGTQRYRGDETPAFFRAVVTAFRDRADRRVLLSLGRHLTPAELGPLPDHIVACPSVPQVAVLGHTSAMVTHGGLGTVKECITAGVPMVVLPLAVDQEGNAARVAHHRLGRVGTLGAATAPQLAAWVDEVIGSAPIAAALDATRREFELVERRDTGADVVEAVGRRRPLPPNPPYRRTSPGTALRTG